MCVVTDDAGWHTDATGDEFGHLHPQKTRHSSLLLVQELKKHLHEAIATDGTSCDHSCLITSDWSHFQSFSST